MSLEETLDLAVLNVYGQASWRDDVILVANPRALKQLRDTIDRALVAGDARLEDLIASDGEEYSLDVIREDAPYESDPWLKAAVPYSAPGAAEKRPDAMSGESRVAERRGRSDAPGGNGAPHRPDHP